MTPRALSCPRAPQPVTCCVSARGRSGGPVLLSCVIASLLAAVWQHIPSPFYLVRRPRCVAPVPDRGRPSGLVACSARRIASETPDPTRQAREPIDPVVLCGLYHASSLPLPFAHKLLAARGARRPSPLTMTPPPPRRRRRRRLCPRPRRHRRRSPRPLPPPKPPPPPLPPPLPPPPPHSPPKRAVNSRQAAARATCAHAIASCIRRELRRPSSPPPASPPCPPPPPPLPLLLHSPAAHSRDTVPPTPSSFALRASASSLGTAVSMQICKYVSKSA